MQQFDRVFGPIGRNIRTYQQITVTSAAVRDFYLVRFWSPRRSGVTLATTHKAGFLDPGGWHSCYPIVSYAVGILHMTKMYVGNLPFSMDESAVRALFEKHGAVQSVALINDRDTGRPRGFGFVEMASADAARAMAALNGHDVDGRALKVNEAQERTGGGGGGGGGGSRGPKRW
jgi:RNA recognition motif. (a.k.a. RRM, RBD, or RNP domain)